MPAPVDLIITAAGLDALVDAQNGETEAIVVTEVGLSATPFDAAPTLTALPGEMKRLASVAGQSVAPNVIHMTAQDHSTDTYDLFGVGLYLADGSLFATFGQRTPIIGKASPVSFLLAFDVRFSGDLAGAIEFGDANFLYPPASETLKGVARIATTALAQAGVDDETIVSPLKLRAVLLPIVEELEDADTALQQGIDALKGRSVTGGGLAKGGGDLSQDRIITVTEASAADMTAGQRDDRVVTPRRAANLLPAGAVFAFAMTAAPAGYLACDGSNVSRTQYAALFAAIGTSFGNGDGATTFTLPDLRGEFVRGWSNTRGVDAGRPFGSAQADELRAHSHAIKSGTGGGAQLESGQGGTSTTNQTETTGGVETRPRNVALLYAIKT